MDLRTELIAVLNAFDYAKAVALYRQHGKNEYLKIICAKGESIHNRQRLKEELLKMRNELPMAPPVSISKADKVFEPNLIDTAEITDLKNERLRNFKLQVHYHGHLLDLETDAERATYMAQIQELETKNDAIFYKLEFYDTYKRLPEMANDEVDLITDRAEMAKQLERYKKYIRDVKSGKGNRNATNLPDWENKVNKLEVKLRQG